MPLVLAGNVSPGRELGGWVGHLFDRAASGRRKGRKSEGGNLAEMPREAKQEEETIEGKAGDSAGWEKWEGLKWKEERRQLQTFLHGHLE